jgi:hypothetical protein
MSKNINIPTVTDLVAAGDPKLKAKAQNADSTYTHIDELNLRIDELENAIGQDNKGPIGRAFAIRAESNSSIAKRPRKSKCSS